MFLGRTVGPGEPMWLEEDRAWALALLAYEADRCECGQSRAESTTREAEFTYRAEAMRCHACKAAAEAAEGVSDRTGLYVTVSKLK